MGRHAVLYERHGDVQRVSAQRRLLAALGGLAALLASAIVGLGTAAPASADTNPCTPGDITCVGVGAGGGGSGGGTQPPRGGGRGGGTGKPDPCAKYPASYAALCSKSQGAGPLGCLGLYDQYYGTMPLAQFNAFVTRNGCPAVGPAAKPPPTPAQLAEQAAASFHLALPSGHRSPAEDKDIGGYPFTYIHLWTFYWTDPGTWRSLTATASAGGNFATVTATPVSLAFDPGDGSSSASCGGPGRPWLESDGNGAPTDGACGFQYSHITGPAYGSPVTSTQTITWQLTWTGSNNTNGSLTSKTTSTNGRLNVLQIQTVNR